MVKIMALYNLITENKKP